MERRCSHCGQLLPAMRLGVPLPPLKARIFDAISRATPSGGISLNDLFEMIYPDKPVTEAALRTLSAHISQINDKLAEDYYIDGHKRPYRLLRRQIKEIA